MDCDAQENLDMRKLLDEWGWEWYGRYYAILGKIGMLVTENQQTFALQTNNGSPFPVKLLANDLGTTVERLSDFCRFLADNHLIDAKAWSDKNLIYCPKLKERADEYTKKLLTKSRHSPDQEVDKKKIRIEEERVVVPPPPKDKNKFKKDDVGYDGKNFTYKDGVYQRLKKVFFDKDFDFEINKAERWLLSHPDKKDYTRFLCNWLNRADMKKTSKYDPKPLQRAGVESAPKAVDFGKYNPNA